MSRFFYTLAVSIAIYSILIVTLFNNFNSTKKDISNNYKKDEQIITLIKETKKIEQNLKNIKKQNKIVKEIKKEKNIVKKSKIKQDKIVKEIKIEKKIQKEEKVEKKQILKIATQPKVNIKEVEQKLIQNVSKHNSIKSTNVQLFKQKIITNKTANSEKLNLQKNKYYVKIKDTINQNKQYPRIAKRVGIEGAVKIDFVLSSTGDLLSYEIIEGGDIFKRSVVEAIENSFPLETPKGLFKNKLYFTINIEYNLY